MARGGDRQHPRYVDERQRLPYKQDHEAGIDLRSWRSASWSYTEEALVNFIARAVLAPSQLVRSPESRDENLSSYVVAHIASTFHIPHRVAAIRVLDLEAVEGIRAFVMWRQYHPFSDSLIDRCFRSFSDLRSNLRDAARLLRSELGAIPFARARAVWEQVFRRRADGNAPAVLGMSPRDADLAHQIRHAISLSTDSRLQGQIDLFLDPGSPLFFRPEWVVWRGRPARAFVPERRRVPEKGRYRRR